MPTVGHAAGADGRVIAAPAKVNLFLEVLGKRADGYHDLASLVVPVNLYDTLEVRRTGAAGIELTCDPPGLPTGPANLVWKAADELRKATGATAGTAIRLTKRIPHDAGLGGGSSDAAATLRALNDLWGCGLGDAALIKIGARVGSDVPALIAGPCRATGRGEVVTPMPSGATIHLVIVKSPVGCPTADVYRRVEVPANPKEIGEAIAAWKSGDPVRIAAALHNRLQGAAFALQPILARIYARLWGCGPLGCLLAGSGSSLFAVCRDRGHAAEVARRFAASAAGEFPGCRVFEVAAPPPEH